MPTKEREYPPLNLGLYRFVKVVFSALFRTLARLQVTGLENIPKEGGFIMLTNHLSYIDAPAEFVAMPRILYVLAAEKYERNLFLGMLLRVAGAIFIDRGEPDRDAIRQAIAVLKAGYALGLAIEGTRSKTGGLQQAKSGVAYFATRADVPVVPTAIWGSETVFRDLRRLRRPSVYIHFGEPVKLPPGRVRSEQLDAYSEELIITLARMLPEEYRGIYRDHPEVAGHAPVRDTRSIEASNR